MPALILRELDLEILDDRLRYLLLNREDVAEFTFIDLRP